MQVAVSGLHLPPPVAVKKNYGRIGPVIQIRSIGSELLSQKPPFGDKGRDGVFRGYGRLGLQQPSKRYDHAQ